MKPESTMLERCSQRESCDRLLTKSLTCILQDKKAEYVKKQDEMEVSASACLAMRMTSSCFAGW